MTLFLKLIFKEIYHYLKDKNQRQFLKLAFKYGNIERYTEKKVRFLNYRFTVPDTLSFIWQFKEIFADGNYKFYTKNPIPVIYDCGSNVGTSCLYFSKLYPDAKIKAFEADPHIAGILRSNLQDNNISNAEVNSKAVWIDNNGIEISIEGADAASVYGDTRKLKVESVRLKELLEKESHIDFLKIDIEGAEDMVLEDCKNNLSNVDNIFIEYHSFNNRKQELGKILNILSSNDFTYILKSGNNKPLPFINKNYSEQSDINLLTNIFAFRKLH